MKNYRNRLQIKLYAEQHGLFFYTYFKDLLDHTVNKVYKEGDLIQEKENSDFLHFIHDGQVIGCDYTNKKYQIYRIVMANDIFGNTLMHGENLIPRYNWQAASKVMLSRIRFSLIMDQLPPEFRYMLKTHILDKENERLNLLNRLYKLKSDEKFQVLERVKPHLLLYPKQKYICSFLGISPRTLNRILNAINHIPS